MSHKRIFQNSPLLAAYDALDQSQSPSLRELDYLVLLLVFRALHEGELLTINGLSCWHVMGNDSVLECKRGSDDGNVSKILRDSVKLAMDWNRPDIVRDEFLSLAFNVEKVRSEIRVVNDDGN